MRLWTVHPKYLDSKGLVALWRESLLAKKVLQNKTTGYVSHPQLIRFKETRYPLQCINQYLMGIFKESIRRGYSFDQKKVRHVSKKHKMIETSGQLLYEFEHLKTKLKKRDSERYEVIRSVATPEHHPIFTIKVGLVRKWENVQH